MVKYFEQFLQDESERLRSFADYWRSGNHANPQSFPMVSADGNDEEWKSKLASFKGEMNSSIIQKPCQMTSPAFDRDGDPTDETLDAIQKWQPDFDNLRGPWFPLIDFLKNTWAMGYGTIREEFSEDDGKEPLLCFITGGWSSNEIIQGAMNQNVLFRVMCWHSSFRGGKVRYSGVLNGYKE